MLKPEFDNDTITNYKLKFYKQKFNIVENEMKEFTKAHTIAYWEALKWIYAYYY